jgi:hypothetical protein
MAKPFGHLTKFIIKRSAALNFYVMAGSRSDAAVRKNGCGLRVNDLNAPI